MRAPQISVGLVMFLAFKVAVVATVATMLVLVVGGFHYLSTTNNGAQPGSLAVFGLIRYPFYTALVALGVGVGCHLWTEHSVKQTRREQRDDDSSTLDVIDDWNRRN